VRFSCYEAGIDRQSDDQYGVVFSFISESIFGASLYEYLIS
jgi:hypothetical protein